MFHEIVSLSNIFHAWKEFRRGKGNNPEIAAFELHLEDNLFQLHQELVDGIYVHDPYVDFYICDPKRRHIHKASVRDRVVYQAVYRVFYPIFDKHFIFDSYSSRVSKGTHKGVARLASAGRKVTKNWRCPAYALKCDVQKFFDSIDHCILKDLISMKISEKETIDFIGRILNSFEKTSGRGLPLGNVTSQLFANIYLNELDQYVKHTLKAKFYFRYCDDFVIVSDTREFLEQVLVSVQDFLSRTLNLELHPQKISTRKFRQGIDFLGYVILPHALILRTKTVRRISRKVVELSKDFDRGKSDQYLKAVLDSYIGVLSHCHSKKMKDMLLKLKESLEC